LLTPMTELALDCGAASDTGRVRESNEDRCWMDAARGTFLVVDGVGGQVAGEHAAEIAVAAVREAMAIDSAEPPAARVRQAIAAANKIENPRLLPPGQLIDLNVTPPPAPFRIGNID